MGESLFSKRNEAIDMLRGLTMLLMVFVNDLWSVGGVPHCLEHFEVFEDGMGLADFVFPMFLFAMGMSVPYALERRYAKGYSGESTISHILSRTLALLLMGVFIVNTEGGFDSTLGYGKNFYRLLMVAAFFLIWNAYPSGMKAKKWLQCLGAAILAFLALTFRTPQGGFFTAQWWGILGLIGWTYCFCAFAYILLRDKPLRVVYLWVILIILNILLTVMRDGVRIVGGPSFISDIAGVFHLGNAAWAIMATGGMLLSLSERWLTDRPARIRLSYAFAAAALLACAAALSHKWWIISKHLASLPYCLYVSALSIAAYAILRVLEAYGRTKWFRLLRPAGTATLTVYMMPYVLYSIFSIVDFYTLVPLAGWIGLVKCGVLSLVCVGLAGLLSKAGIRLKI